MRANGPADVAALVWACEMTALEDAAERVPSGSVMWLDFDAFLENPVAGLSEIAAHLGIKANHGRIAQIGRGPLMHRYSKATEHEFGPDTRRHLLSETGAKHGEAIAAALAMLAQAAEKAPLLQRALRRSMPEC
jgi:hypothetical protein